MTPEQRALAQVTLANTGRAFTAYKRGICPLTQVAFLGGELVRNILQGPFEGQLMPNKTYRRLRSTYGDDGEVHHLNFYPFDPLDAWNLIRAGIPVTTYRGNNGHGYKWQSWRDGVSKTGHYRARSIKQFVNDTRGHTLMVTRDSRYVSDI